MTRVSKYDKTTNKWVLQTEEESRGNEVIIECWPYSTAATTSRPGFKLNVGIVVRVFMLIGILLIYWQVDTPRYSGMYYYGWAGLAALLMYFFSMARGLSIIKIEPFGIDLEWRAGSETVRTQRLPWTQLKEVYVEESKLKSKQRRKLCFRLKNDKVFKVKFSQIATLSNWERILHGIQKNSNISIEHLRESSFEDVAISQQDPGFTQLWLEALSEPPKRNRLEPLTPGALLRGGKYNLVRQIGAGGQGFAYLATEDGGRQVVLKEYLLPVYVDAKARRQAIERFEQEARLLLSLDNPNIVKLFEFFVEDHRAYMVLEYIDGTSLQRRVADRGKLSERETVDYALTMCDVLQYLHEKNPPLIHRDFTPDNLIVSSDGVLKLIDFTVADQTPDTVTATIVGKQSYMPPEQFRGKTVPQSDIYALGATLYFLLTGTEPEPLASLHPIIEVENVTGEMDQLVSRCTALDLPHRYGSAAEVKTDLERLSRAADAGQ